MGWGHASRELEDTLSSTLPLLAQSVEMRRRRSVAGFGAGVCA